MGPSPRSAGASTSRRWRAASRRTSGSSTPAGRAPSAPPRRPHPASARSAAASSDASRSTSCPAACVGGGCPRPETPANRVPRAPPRSFPVIPGRRASEGGWIGRHRPPIRHRQGSEIQPATDLLVGSPRWLRGRRMPTARDHCEPRAAGPAAIFLHHPAAPSQRRGGWIGRHRPPIRHRRGSEIQPATDLVVNPPPSRIRNPTCDGSRRYGSRR